MKLTTLLIVASLATACANSPTSPTSSGASLPFSLSAESGERVSAAGQPPPFVGDIRYSCDSKAPTAAQVNIAALSVNQRLSVDTGAGSPGYRVTAKRLDAVASLFEARESKNHQEFVIGAEPGAVFNVALAWDYGDGCGANRYSAEYQTIVSFNAPFVAPPTTGSAPGSGFDDEKNECLARNYKPHRRGYKWVYDENACRLVRVRHYGKE